MQNGKILFRMLHESFDFGVKYELEIFLIIFNEPHPDMKVIFR